MSSADEVRERLKSTSIEEDFGFELYCGKDVTDFNTTFSTQNDHYERFVDVIGTVQNYLETNEVNGLKEELITIEESFVQ